MVDASTTLPHALHTLRQLPPLRAPRSDLEEADLLPFAPLERHLALRGCNTRLALVLEAASNASLCLERLLPLHAMSSLLLLGDFTRGYDIAAGYLLLNEAILEEYSHGTRFAQNDETDRRFKALITSHVDSVTEALAKLKLAYPQLSTCINTIKAARMVLNAGRELVVKIQHHGGLADTEVRRTLDCSIDLVPPVSTVSPCPLLAPHLRLALFTAHVPPTSRPRPARVPPASRRRVECSTVSMRRR